MISGSARWRRLKQLKVAAPEGAVPRLVRLVRLQDAERLALTAARAVLTEGAHARPCDRPVVKAVGGAALPVPLVERVLLR